VDDAFGRTQSVAASATAERARPAVRRRGHVGDAGDYRCLARCPGGHSRVQLANSRAGHADPDL